VPGLLVISIGVKRNEKSVFYHTNKKDLSLTVEMT